MQGENMDNSHLGKTIKELFELIEELTNAIKRDDVKVFEVLADEGFDIRTEIPFYSRTTILHMAVMEGGTKVVEFLLDRYSNQIGFGKLPSHDRFIDILICACSGYSNLAIVKLLINRGASAQISIGSGGNLLHSVALDGDCEMLQFFIDQGLNINAQDLNGNTPLHVAGWANFTAAIELLLKNGADGNIRNNAGELYSES